MTDVCLKVGGEGSISVAFINGIECHCFIDLLVCFTSESAIQSCTLLDLMVDIVHYTSGSGRLARSDDQNGVNSV